MANVHWSFRNPSSPAIPSTTLSPAPEDITSRFFRWQALQLWYHNLEGRNLNIYPCNNLSYYKCTYIFSFFSQVRNAQFSKFILLEHLPSVWFPVR